MTLLTAAELSFVYHYGRETSGAVGPAITWLPEHRFSGRALDVFQYWGERNDDEFINKSLFGPYPPFEAPWKSRKEFIDHVHEIMETYPQLREYEPIEFSRPGEGPC
jgi:hypothetical protein